ncbi:MAG: hypothetical protein WC326_03630 [Candidatus Delongbacteria bacterium]
MRGWTGWLALAPLLALAQAEVEWVEPTGGVAVAVDPQLNVYTVSYDYNPAGDIRLTKRDNTGLVLWSTGYDQTDPGKWEQATWVDCDSQGNTLVSGTLKSGYSNPVNAASLLMKFAPDGALLWRVVYESDFDGSWTRKCLVDGQDNVYVLGVGPGPSGFTAQVKSFAPDGSARWTWHDLQGIGSPINLKPTPDDGLLVVTRTSAGNFTGYAKLSQDGALLWSLPGLQSLSSGDAAGDAQGHTYLVHGEYVFNGGTVLRKLDATGAELWNRVLAFGGTRVEVGPDQQPLLSGTPSPNGVGAAFWKTDAAGTTLWSNLDADGPLMLLQQVQLRLDDQGAAYLAAGLLGTAAVCKVDAAGASQWTLTVSGGSAAALDLGADGNVYLTGGQTAKIRQVAPRPQLSVERLPACGTRLSWTAVPGALEYRVYEAGGLGSPWSLLGSTTQQEWLLPCLTDATRLYQVTAQLP